MEPLIGSSPDHVHRTRFDESLVFPRRGFLKLAGLGALNWLTPVGHLLAAHAERTRQPAQSVILIWLNGGPSQLETFDPHAGKKIAGGTKAIATAVKGIELAEGYPRLADMMASVSLVRSLVSKEGDHERGTYYVKTGYRPDQTVEHPSVGAICCHELPVGETGIPRHISILPSKWPGRGGFLGAEYDAFKTDDPSKKLPDVTAQVADARMQARLRDLDVVETAFARGRRRLVDATLHRDTIRRARVMMTSAQLKAFDITQEPLELRRAYGETAIGRACLAARRLTEVGVRCVELTLDGWDSHVNNHEVHRSRAAELDPALSTLIRDLRDRGTLDKTVVLCTGEFGRTPKVNLAGGRDHWPSGFSLAIAGGGIQGGRVLGATDPEGIKEPVHPLTMADVHATILQAVGLDPKKENISPVGRPIKLSEGRPVRELLS
jgi:uncharacterized protein (DUF1501 family)